MITEDRLLERIVAALGRRARGDSALRLGIGDDAAVIAGPGHIDWVVSTDAFLEGIHFQPELDPADSVGYKALARATSDLAAMGARPRFFLLTFALPPRRLGDWLDRFFGGVRRAARRFAMTAIGGDTTRSQTIFISITVLGEIARGRAVLRSGARPGDLIYVTGTLGAAQLGFVLLRHGLRKSGQRPENSPLRAHLYPPIRVDWGLWLARHELASAMIDVSDGLSTDLGRLCAASRVGARIWADQIPSVRVQARGKRETAVLSKLSPLRLALDGGDDYELLFTVPPSKVRRLSRAPRFSELTEIGEISPARKLTLVSRDGTSRPVVEAGWDPFRSK